MDEGAHSGVMVREEKAEGKRECGDGGDILSDVRRQTDHKGP